jgi:hypothetical protein
MKYRLLPPCGVGVVEEWPRRAEQDIAEMFIHFDALGRSMSSRAERIPWNQRHRTAVAVLNCCSWRNWRNLRDLLNLIMVLAWPALCANVTRPLRTGAMHRGGGVVDRA